MARKVFTSSRQLTIGLLLIGWGILCMRFAHGAEMPTAVSRGDAIPIPTTIPDTSNYVGRQLAHPLCRPLEYNAIVLPLITSAKVIAPRLVVEQQVALASYRDEHPQAKFLWKAFPWRVEHAEFVTRWNAAKNNESQRFELYRWCEQQELFDCAEFLLRQGLYDYQYKASSDNYRWYLNKWKENGAHQRRSPFTFTLPVRGQWKVMVDTDRHHQAKHWSVWAWDLVMPRGYDLRQGADVVQNYYTWRQPVYAVSDGVVVAAVDHFPDHQIGYNAPADQGNYVQIDCGGGVYAYYGHLRQRGVHVRKGDKVQQGQVLGLIGSSGDTGTPHLHFTLMDGDGFSIRGRYQLEVWTVEGWRAYDGLDLEEGWHFREVRN